MNKLWVRLSLAFTVVVLVAVLIIVVTGFFLQQLGRDDDRTNRFLSQPNGLVDNLPILFFLEKILAPSDTVFNFGKSPGGGIFINISDFVNQGAQECNNMGKGVNK